jgi:hypothetical protein
MLISLLLGIQIGAFFAIRKFLFESFTFMVYTKKLTEKVRSYEGAHLVYAAFDFLEVQFTAF